MHNKEDNSMASAKIGTGDRQCEKRKKKRKGEKLNDWIHTKGQNVK